MIDKSNIKSHIIQRTTELFLTQGYTKTTTKQIAKISDISEGALFRIFEDKESVYLAIIKEIIDNKIITLNSFNDYIKLLVTGMHISNDNYIVYDLLQQALSLKKTSTYLNEKFASFFKERINTKNLKEYYELEVALCGMYLSYLTLDTNIYFNIDYKTNRYIDILYKLLDYKDSDHINLNDINYKLEYNLINAKIKEYFIREGGNN